MEREKLNDLSILERMDTTRAMKYSKGFIKIGIGISSLIASIGYPIQKIKD